MSFISTVSDDEIQTTGTALGVGVQETIPERTKLLTIIASVTIVPESEFSGTVTNEHVKITVDVLTEGEYVDYSLNHKLHVHHDDIKKRDKARQNLLEYDANAKGDILKSINEGKDVLSNQNLLARALVGTKTVSEVAVWSNDNGEGNFIRSMFPPSESITTATAKNTAPPINDIDDVPF